MESKGRFQVLTLNQKELKVHDYEKRRAHRKSKAGCHGCKERRVKVSFKSRKVHNSRRRTKNDQCDESKPVCLRCQRGKRACVYSQSTDGPQPSSQIARRRIPEPMEMSFSVLDSTTVDPFFSSGDHSRISADLRQHFQRHWTSILPMPRGDTIVSLSSSNSLMQSTLLALTSAHLKILFPESNHQSITAHFHTQVALEAYQAALKTPMERLDQYTVNILILSGSLMNMVAFALPESNELGDSWVFSTSESRLDWLALQVGINSLVDSMGVYSEASKVLLAGLFLGSADKWALWRMGLSTVVVPQEWRLIFGLDQETPSVFRLAVLLLAALQDLPGDATRVFRGWQFIGKINPEFRRLLFEKDDRALWLSGYWLGVMCRFRGMWWCETRAMRDYTAICVWLEHRRLDERGGLEGAAWKRMMDDLRAAPKPTEVRLLDD